VLFDSLRFTGGRGAPGLGDRSLALAPRRRLIRLRGSKIGGNFLDFIFVLQLHEVGNIEERIALQANIHECGLHAWQNAGYAAFIDGTS
jgi:hypothetical protein